MHACTDAGIDCSSQSSFAAGVLIMSISTGTHPLPGYPTTYTDRSNTISYSKGNILPIPRAYPKSFHSIIQDLLVCEPERRLCVGEALNQLKVCCWKRKTVSLSELRGLSAREEGNESVSNQQLHGLIQPSASE